jgi:hypothetical protein
MKRFLLITVVTVLASTPAWAGLFSTALADSDARGIRRLAVVSALGDTVHGRLVGLTAFQNKSFDGAAPDWGLDTTVAARLRDSILASGRVPGEVTPLVAPSSETKKIIAFAKDQGFDAVLVLHPQEDPNDRSIGPGPTLSRRQILGHAKSQACNGMSVYIYHIADDKEIGHANAYSCPNGYAALPWHDNWLEFTDEERRVVLDALQIFIEQQIDAALVTLKLQAH